MGLKCPGSDPSLFLVFVFLYTVPSCSIPLGGLARVGAFQSFIQLALPVLDVSVISTFPCIQLNHFEPRVGISHTKIVTRVRSTDSEMDLILGFTLAM